MNITITIQGDTILDSDTLKRILNALAVELTPAPAVPEARAKAAAAARVAYEVTPAPAPAPVPVPIQEAEEEEAEEEEAASTPTPTPTPTPTAAGGYNELTRDQLKALIRSRKIMGRVPEAVSAEQLRELLRNYDQRHATAPAPALAPALATSVEEPEPEPEPESEPESEPEPEPEPVQEEEEEDWSPGIGEKVSLTYQGAMVTGTIQEIKYEEHRLLVRIPAGLVKIAPEKCKPIK